jgi:hypothetical protein
MIASQIRLISPPARVEEEPEDEEDDGNYQQQVDHLNPS